MKILFIGGTGRLSKDVAKLAADLGNQVYLLTRGSKSRALFADERYQMLYCDIKNADNARKTLEGHFFDVIIDFITYTPEQLQNTLDIISGKYTQYIFISTATVYKRDNYDELISEARTPTGNDKWSYAYNKYLCEERIKDYFADRDETYTIIRPSVTYGDTRIPYPIVPGDTQKEYSFIDRIKSGAPIPVFDNGATETTLTNSKDFAKGVLGLMGNEKAYSEAFHITSDEKLTWESVLSCLEEILNVKVNRFYVSQKDIYSIIPYYEGILVGDKGNKTRFDNSKILSTVPGLSFDVSLREGLEETVRFYEVHPDFQRIDYHWQGCMDRLAKKNHCAVNKVNIIGRENRVAYLRGRYPACDNACRALQKIKRMLRG